MSISIFERFHFLDTISLNGYVHLFELKHPKVSKEYCKDLTAPINPDIAYGCRPRLVSLDIFSTEEKPDFKELIKNDSLLHFHDGHPNAYEPVEDLFLFCDNNGLQDFCRSEFDSVKLEHFEDIRTIGAKIHQQGLFGLYEVDRDYFYYFTKHKLKKYDNFDVRELPEEIFVVMPICLDEKH